MVVYGCFDSVDLDGLYYPCIQSWLRRLWQTGINDLHIMSNAHVLRLVTIIV